MALAIPTLNEGEIYIGAIISADGTRNHHLILLPDTAENLDWQDANAWAESIGGELPDRVEGALLYAHAKDQFKKDWYWTREQHAANSDNAWGQSFTNGRQDGSYKSYRGRARAVRRLVIE